MRTAWRWVSGSIGMAAMLMACARSPVESASAPGTTGTTASQRAAERRSGRWIPDGLGVQHGVVVMAPSTEGSGRDARVFVRGDDPDTASSPGTLATLVTLLAGVRAGRVDGAFRHECRGNHCIPAHGTLGGADALRVGCLHFFETLAPRLGPGALGAAFSSLGVAPPPIPADLDAHVRLATRSNGWTLTPRAALPMARALAQRPAPWSSVMDEALVLRAPDAGSLRGAVGVDNLSGWFVGYSTSAEPWVLVVRVHGCTGGCDDEVVRVARWALDRVRGIVPDGYAVPPGTVAGHGDAGAPGATRMAMGAAHRSARVIHHRPGASHRRRPGVQRRRRVPSRTPSRSTSHTTSHTTSRSSSHSPARPRTH